MSTTIASTLPIFFPTSFTLAFALFAVVCLGADIVRRTRPQADPFHTVYSLFCAVIGDPYCVYIGWSAYWIPPAVLAAQIFAPFPQMPLPLVRLAQLQGGRQLVGLVSECFYRKPDPFMFIHHFGFLTALVCTPTAYVEGILTAGDVCFFGGLCEISTIMLNMKLLINEWYTKPYSPAVKSAYQATRYGFLALFVGVRLVWWNIHAAGLLQRACFAPMPLSTGSRMLVGSLFVMTGLQLYWGGLIGRLAYREVVVPLRNRGANTATPQGDVTEHDNNDNHKMKSE